MGESQETKQRFDVLLTSGLVRIILATENAAAEQVAM